MPKGIFTASLAVIVGSLLSPNVVRADFSKIIQAAPGVPVQVVTTWVLRELHTIIGRFSINVAPKYGSVSFASVSGPVPGCPAGSPSLPAVAAFSTLSTKVPTGTSDYFQLYYLLNNLPDSRSDSTGFLKGTVMLSHVLSRRL